MIRVVIKRNFRLDPIALSISGHAGYGDSGSDIICSAVSILAYTLANSIETYTDVKFNCHIDEESGDFLFSFVDDYDDGALLLLNSCILGIKSIKDEYGSQYINITDQEV